MVGLVEKQLFHYMYELFTSDEINFNLSRKNCENWTAVQKKLRKKWCQYSIICLAECLNEKVRSSSARSSNGKRNLTEFVLFLGSLASQACDKACELWFSS